jgi:hypothetical protein
MEVDRPVDVRVSAASERFAADDEGWLRQVAELRRSLVSVGRIAPDSTAVKGSKGWVDAVIITLISAPTVNALAGAFRTWLQRDQDRSITASFQVGDSDAVTIRVDAANVSDATIRDAYRRALDHATRVSE